MTDFEALLNRWQSAGVLDKAATDRIRAWESEHKRPSPLPVQPGQELWIEATVPPQSPPRPTQLALNQDGIWKPLAFQ
jgi:hypothetical protein